MSTTPPPEGGGETLFQPAGRLLLDAKRRGLIERLQTLPAQDGLGFYVALAGCGLLIGPFSMTGVVSSLANDLLRIAGDNAFLLLVMCAFTVRSVIPRLVAMRRLSAPAAM